MPMQGKARLRAGDRRCKAPAIALINPAPDKGDILHQLFLDGLATPPESCTFHIHSDEIHVRVSLSQADGVFPFSASQFNNDRMIIVKKILFPP